LHFLAAANPGDELLFVNFDEPTTYVTNAVDAFDLDLSMLHHADLSPGAEEFRGEASYSAFKPADVEGSSLRAELIETIEEVDPDRVLIDAATQFHHISGGSFQFRKQMRALLKLLEQSGATTVFTAPTMDASPDQDLQFTADTVVELGYADDHEWRTFRVIKFRDSGFQRGWHALRIDEEGVVVVPRPQPQEHGQSFSDEQITSGVPELDDLLHGGLERGTVTMLTGTTGAGKTTTGLQFISAAADRGERAVLFSFEESTRTLVKRGESIDIPVQEMIDEGLLQIEQIRPNDLTSIEVADRVREEVAERDARLVMVDGLTGYQAALVDVSGNQTAELLTLLTYLRNMGVTTLLTNEVSQVVGGFEASGKDFSYLPDNIVFFRQIEHEGALKKVIGVLKKRTSDYETTLRRLEITEDGIQVGEPLTQLRGILTGTPEWPENAFSEAGED
jgi:circadian clock protein KaiC